jgi:DNA (cytosine-5)-methyltransferase 1
VTRPLVLDLCCKEGGASRGYVDAGFDVVGVDIESQPQYPYSFIKADALDILRDLDFVSRFAFVHASWPCQSYGPLRALSPHKTYPDLIEPGRKLLLDCGRPWVIENVMTAPLDRTRSIVLCGGMFGLRTYRHRRFEPSPGLALVAPEHPKHVARTATKQRRARWAEGWHVSITGDVGVYVGPEAMGIDWMSGNGLSEAIPPAYTRVIGEQVMRQAVKR